MIEITDYSKSYSGKLVLEIPSLTIPEGIHTVSGTNGSGKTTLLKCIAGILPYKGQISINGVANSKKNMKEYLKSVRYSPAEPIFPSFLQSNDLINFYTSVLPTDNHEVKHFSDAFGVSSFKEVEIGNYSSGMLKKLSLTLAFIGSSELIILDEPYNALDVETCQVLDEMISSKRASGISFLITSHQGNSYYSMDSEFKIENGQIAVNESTL